MAGLRYPEDRAKLSDLRAEMHGFAEAFRRRAIKRGGWTEIKVPFGRADGSSGTICTYRPAAAGATPLPLLYYMHPGGFVTGSAEDEHILFRLNGLLRSGAPVLLASVDYRLAPEHPFPAAVEDSLAGLSHLLDSHGLAEELGFRTDAVHLAGISAGANLAAVVMMEMARQGRAISSVLLESPPLDPSCASESHAVNGRVMPGSAWMRWSWALYLRAEPEAARQPQCCPLLQEPLREGQRLPPVLCVTALGDPLGDEGAGCVEWLRSRGAAVTHVEARGSHLVWPVVDGAAREKFIRAWAALLGPSRAHAPASRL